MQTHGSDTTGHRSRSARPVRAVRFSAALLLTGLLALTGCSGPDDTGSADKAAAPTARDAGAGAAGSESAARGEQAGAREAPPAPAVHVIRTASLTVRVEDVPKSLDRARTVAEDAGGLVADESTDRDSRGRERSHVVLRVPADTYQEVLDELAGSGRLVERRVKAQDVTEQVVDVQSRITTQRASVARIRELMDRASELSDVVTLESELSTRQADLEALLARQASLKDRTSLATITLSLSGRPVEKAAEDDDPGIADALGGGWDAFVGMFHWIALAVGAVLPFLAGAALLLFLWLRFLRGRTPGRPAPAARPEQD